MGRSDLVLFQTIGLGWNEKQKKTGESWLDWRHLGQEAALTTIGSALLLPNQEVSITGGDSTSHKA